MVFGNNVTLIGSRKAPQEVLEIQTQIGNRLSLLGIKGFSGGAPGSDYAFMKDYDKDLRCVIIPTNGFNGHYRDIGIHVFTDLDIEIRNKAEKLARHFYKDYDIRNEMVQYLQCRNMMQVLGLSLNKKVDSVIFWGPENSKGVIKGGTRTAVYLARYLGIKTYNLYFQETMGFVKAELGLTTSLDSFF
ncbi:TPA: hypothetical protein ACOA2N_003437 [Vibrio cholerae]